MGEANVSIDNSITSTQTSARQQPPNGQSTTTTTINNGVSVPPTTVLYTGSTAPQVLLDGPMNTTTDISTGNTITANVTQSNFTANQGNQTGPGTDGVTTDTSFFTPAGNGPPQPAATEPHLNEPTRYFIGPDDNP